jgi:hypothetical protein
MILCQSCGNQNPMGTRYCRRCGTKIEINQQQVFQAVQDNQSDIAATRWMERGRSILIIGVFFLVCALVLRYAVVPEMPLADVPPVAVGGFLPDQLPQIEAKTVPSDAPPKPAVTPAQR